MYYADDTVKILNDSSELLVFGARIVANEVASVLMNEPYGYDIKAFLVSSHEGNPNSLLGRKVITIDEGAKKYGNATVVIASMEKHVEEIREALEKAGFSKIVVFSFECDLWSEIRGNTYKYMVEKDGREYATLEEELSKIKDDGEKTSSNVYRVSCHLDKPIKSDFAPFDWEKVIQVGAALTDKDIAETKDNTGDNISEKNPQYCELTALYWMWKNDTASKYIGLCHYRRHFSITDRDLRKLELSDIDVVLTIPILNFPSVRYVYEHDHVIDDWDTLKEGMKQIHSEYLRDIEELEQGQFYYAYNMFIARHEIFDDYCSWLFPLLDYCEEHCKEKETVYQKRYIGFLAERLLSVYMLHNKGKYKIVHARKNFFEK